MKNPTTGNTPVDHTDWDKVRAMTDAQIAFDDDAPRTTVQDWQGATIKRSGKPVGCVDMENRQKM